MQQTECRHCGGHDHEDYDCGQAPDMHPAIHAVRPTGDCGQPPRRKTDLWEHQIEAYHFALRRPAAMIPYKMGGGKSLVAISLVANRGPANKKVLILCPKSVIGVWRREFERHYPDYTYTMLCLEKGTAARKADLVVQNLRPKRQVPLVIVCNYETARTPAMRAILLNTTWDEIILDESHRIKAPGSQISKLCGQLSTRAEHRLCLTGTPMPLSPGDIFGQYRFLDASILGRFWTHFRDRYAVVSRHIPGKIDRWVNLDELQSRIDTIACFSDFELDLPDVQHIDRYCTLEPKGQRHYDELKAHMVTAVKNGEITASNGAVKLIRLLQATSGYGTTEAGDHVILDTAKQQLLRDIVSDLDEPVCVYCWFTADLAAVETLAAVLGRSYAQVSGGRHELTDHGTMPDVDILGVQMRSGGLGVDLTRARIGIFFSTGVVSHGDFDQVLARQHRPGQDRPVTYYHLLAQGTVDETVRQARQAKRDVVQSIIEGLK